MKFFYNIFVNLLIAAMKIGAFFNYKLKKGLAGRRPSCKKVKSAFSPIDRVIWMHAASLGEYEQGLPVLEKLKDNFPEHKILITFFSPSGYENVIKKKHIADVICYLPFDRKKEVKEFVSTFNTEIFFTVKYDYWYNLLNELRNQGTKIYVVSVLFYETQVFFKPYGNWFVSQLKKNIDWFFHQTKHSTALAKSIGLKNSSTAGDTRFDRVRKLKSQDNFVEFIEEFKQNQKAIIFGSSWETEERLAEIITKKNQKVKLIIAPHDLERVDNLKKIFPEAILYSELKNTGISTNLNSQILIIDSIGLLSKLYSYGDIAIVGGGFHSKGLHNILEAATFGRPVLFGNQYMKNPEADEIIAQNGGEAFEDEYFAAPFILNLLKDEENLKKMGFNAKNFVDSQPNSTEIILKKMLA